MVERIRAAASTQTFGAFESAPTNVMTKRLLLPLALALVVSLSIGCGRGALNSNSLDYSKRLVHDAKTGQYIGVLMGECKVFDRKLGKEIVTYRVERSDGTTIDLSSDKVTVTEQ